LSLDSASFDGRSVVYGFSELDTLLPAYAVTIHMSQGSTGGHSAADEALPHAATYTAITRGKRLVVLVGQKKAVVSPCATPRNGVEATRVVRGWRCQPRSDGKLRFAAIAVT
jgi:ATP-dependent exoDNAse (exonuclease V) alpha subunit